MFSTARAGLADFIQPSLGPLQPNLDDIMDTLEPLTDLINTKLPSVPEEQSSDPLSYKSLGWDYSDTDFQVMGAPAPIIEPNFSTVESNESKLQSFNNELMLSFRSNNECLQQSTQPHSSSIPFQTTVILKTNNNVNNNVKHKNITQQHIKLMYDQQQAQEDIYSKRSINYPSYSTVEDVNTSKNVIDQNIQTLQNISNAIAAPSSDKRNYKLNPTTQPNYKFVNQITTNDFIMPNRTQQSQQQLIHSMGAEPIRVQVSCVIRILLKINSFYFFVFPHSKKKWIRVL